MIKGLLHLILPLSFKSNYMAVYKRKFVITSKLCYRLKKTVKFSAIELINLKKLYIHIYVRNNSYFFEYVYLPMQVLVYILFIT